MDILNRLISYSFFFYIFHHDISNLRSLWRLHRVRENETRLYKKKPTENPKTKILDFEEGCLRRDIPYYHTILQIFKKKNNDILQIWFSRFSKHVFQFLLCEPEGNDPLLEQAWTLSIHGCFVKKES